MDRAKDRNPKPEPRRAAKRKPNRPSSPFEPTPPAEKEAVAKNRALEPTEDFARRRGAEKTARSAPTPLPEKTQADRPSSTRRTGRQTRASTE
jgi:hypothetical protein